MKLIELTRGKTTLVDDDVYEWASKFKWSASKNRHTFYAVRSVTTHGKRRAIYLHREIVKPMGNEQVDHLDGDGLNNLRVNLRPCSQTENQRAFKRKAVKRTSRFRGVSWNKEDSRWKAGLRTGKILFYLGYFSDEEKAARAYDRKALELFGEFAHLNFPKALA